MFVVLIPLTLKYPETYKFSSKVQPDTQLRKVVFPLPEGPNIAVDVLG